MISAKEAKEIIMSNVGDWGTEEMAIEHCVGRILREEIYADRDFPPFNRVTMDGIAILFSDFQEGIREFEIIGSQTAGEKAKTLNGSGKALEIMTGAILSTNADVNIKYEDLEIYEAPENTIAKVNSDNIEQWQNIHKRGKDRKKGDLLLKVGREISAADVAALATVGKSKVLVSKLPKAAIISTGDELVGIDEKPEEHQIRMSNMISIQSKLNELQIENDIYHLLDNYESLVEKISAILDNYDVLILSGGVSKGKADYIPAVLDVLKVEKVFHKVAQRPGKPFWFGKTTKGNCVFALPGNPISTFMCFTVYFLPWLATSLKYAGIPKRTALLDQDMVFKPDLTYYAQVSVIVNKEGSIVATPKTGGGSGDLSNLLETDAFIELPAGQSNFKSGQTFSLFPFRTF